MELRPSAPPIYRTSRQTVDAWYQDLVNNRGHDLVVTPGVDFSCTTKSLCELIWRWNRESATPKVVGELKDQISCFPEENGEVRLVLSRKPVSV